MKLKNIGVKSMENLDAEGKIMSPNPLTETGETEDFVVIVPQCPPSHRLARRVSLGVIALLTVLILAAGIYLLISGNA